MPPERNSGLTSHEAHRRLAQYGPNEIRDLSTATIPKILLRQIKSNFLIYLLIAATIISFIVGKTITAYTILVVIIIVICVGFIQEYRAERSIAALKNMLVSYTTVIRDGREHEIASTLLVPGDLISLRTGEKVPADCLLTRQHDLRLNESVLTGESREITKSIANSHHLSTNNNSVSNNSLFTDSHHSGNNRFNNNNYTDDNLLFMATYVVAGRGQAKVLHTGMNTRFGQITTLITTTQKELPLQKKINHIAAYMAAIAIFISLLTGLVILLTSSDLTSDTLISILILVIALSVSAFPEGLPVVLITTLASGAHRMAAQNAIVNRISIIETLGETTVICSDKTGTITKGEMTAVNIYAQSTTYDITGTGYQAQGHITHKNKNIDFASHPALARLLHCSILCNDAVIKERRPDHNYLLSGSPTESALVILAAKAGIFREDLQFKRLEELPFSSERKMMSILGLHHPAPSTTLPQVTPTVLSRQPKLIYTKGAIEHLLPRCRYIHTGSSITPLTDNARHNIISANHRLASHALRTIAFAYKEIKSSTKDHFEQDLIFLGLVGLEDPPRDEVKPAISACQRAGITVKMITGDHSETALAIARKIGLDGQLIDGIQIDHLTDQELSLKINSYSIFARVRPEHKLRIIDALKRNGEIVTMTGDGVNDAPALKEAHIGVAMGKNGTDVSRSVADLTLKDDNFSTIVHAIAEGRLIFHNIRKFITYQLSCNISELTILFLGVLLSPLLGWQVPLLLALQILFMNLVTDNLPALTLSFTPPSHDTMHRRPHHTRQILSTPFITLIILNGMILALLVLLSYYISFNIFSNSSQYSRTVALLTLICLEIASAFNFRSFRYGVLNRGLFVNPYLIYASAISLLLTILIIYTPLNIIFETVPLPIESYIPPILLSLFLILIFDLLKHLNSRYHLLDLEAF